jgi:hypothetical protein
MSHENPENPGARKVAEIDPDHELISLFDGKISSHGICI